MRIVHVTDCYLPQVGGIESQVADLVRHQIAAGHDVHVVTSTADAVGATAQVHRIQTGWFRGRSWVLRKVRRPWSRCAPTSFTATAPCSRRSRSPSQASP